MAPAGVVNLLESLADEIHAEANRKSHKHGDLFHTSYGMCDLMTALALEHLQELSLEVITFVGLHLPIRNIKHTKTQPSHTIGVIYKFAGTRYRECVVWFDYACAQYGINQKVLVRQTNRNNFYRDLAAAYGGGIWIPGGSWLSQLDPHTVYRDHHAPPTKRTKRPRP
jgi:hypothetical protein